MSDLGITQWTTPGKYVYIVPKMVTEVMIEAWGGGGGGGQFKHVKGGLGGGGSFVQTIIEVSVERFPPLPLPPPLTLAASHVVGVYVVRVVARE